MKPGSSVSRHERLKQKAIARDLLLAQQREDNPEIRRIQLAAADMAQGPAHLIRLTEGVVNRRGFTLFEPPVGYIAPLDEEKFFDKATLIQPPPGQQSFSNGATDGTFEMDSVSPEVLVPVTVDEPAPVNVPVALSSGVRTRSRSSGELHAFLKNIFSFDFHCVFCGFLGIFFVFRESMRRKIFYSCILFLFMAIRCCPGSTSASGEAEEEDIWCLIP